MENIVVGPELERAFESSLGDLFYMVLQTQQDSILQVDGLTGEQVTADLLLARAVALAKWFRTKGVKVGDSICINSENRLEFATVPIAAWLIGATFAPLNPDYAPGEIRHVLGLSKPKVVFCTQKTLDKIVDIQREHPYVREVVYIGKESTNKYAHLAKFDDITKGVTPQYDISTFQVTAYNPVETVATILCSSGTTGMPKGVMCTHDSITASIDVARTCFADLAFSEDPSDAMMGLLPFFHLFGFTLMILNILRGKEMVVISKFNPRTFLEAIVKYKVKRLIVPPPVLSFLIKHPMVKEYDLSGVIEIRSGSAPMGTDTEKELKQRFKTDNVSQAYGMTETASGVIVNYGAKSKVGSCGRVVPGMSAKIIDADGNALGPYKEGELCLKGPLVMKGYVGNEAATASTIDKENWLHTGDVAYYDDDQFFFIVDRIKELIKYKGFQVAPAELEALLHTHDSIHDAAVIGLPDEDAGELPLAFVVKKPGTNVTAAEIEKFVADNLSRQKQLRGGVVFIDKIPRDGTGKIVRKVLKQRAIKLKSKL